MNNNIKYSNNKIIKNHSILNSINVELQKTGSILMKIFVSCIIYA